ncbi:MAG TPA: DUF308 domain-containing protein [Geobacteraceae bacterium]|nr:DUF308 domain-containing protein [Geobacteraceae bacterium]
MDSESMEEEKIKEGMPSSGWLMILGVLIMIIGFISVGVPFLVGAATAVYVGGLLIASGIIELAGVFKAKGWGVGIAGFLVSFLSITAGVAVIANPAFGLVMLTLVLAAYFVAHGAGLLILALKARKKRGWRWIFLFDGFLSLLLGILILKGWPISGLWAVGILVGVRIVFSGLRMLTLGMTRYGLPARHDETAG